MFEYNIVKQLFNRFGLASFGVWALFWGFRLLRALRVWFCVRNVFSFLEEYAILKGA